MSTELLNTIFFDLDGTLIDSSHSILESFRCVLATYAIEPAVPLDERLIGPSLNETMARLTGIKDNERLAALTTAFKAVYDEEGFKAAIFYSGLTETLTELTEFGWRLFVVTNKRLHPTNLILDWFNLSQYFAGVYTLDFWQPPATNKAQVVGRVLTAHNLDAYGCVLVGDSSEDAAAAAVHGLRFIAAEYGYGDVTQQRGYPIAARIARLTELPGVLERFL